MRNLENLSREEMLALLTAIGVELRRSEDARDFVTWLAGVLQVDVSWFRGTELELP